MRNSRAFDVSSLFSRFLSLISCSSFFFCAAYVFSRLFELDSSWRIWSSSRFLSFSSFF